MPGYHRTWLWLAFIGAVTMGAPALARDLIIIDGPIVAKDVKCSKCTGTSDLAKGAVSTSRLRSGAVTADKIAGGAVTAAALANGAVSGSKIATGAIAAAAIANGAVTGAAILDGTVTAADLAPGTIPGPSDDLFRRTILVAPAGDGTDALANGLELMDAFADLATESPSAANPWLIKIEPGVYDIGTNTLTLPSFADVEGSGPGVTHIEATVGLGVSAAFVFVMAGNTELRELSIRFEAANATPSVDTGGVTTLGSFVSIRNVTMEGPGRSHEGVRGLTGAAARLRDVEIADVNIAVRQAGEGIIEFDGLRTDRAVVAETGNLIGRRSIVGQIDTGVVLQGQPVGTLSLATTQVLGANTAEPKSAFCVFSYNTALEPLDSRCLPPG